MLINPWNFGKKIAVIKFESRKDCDGFEEKSEVVVLLTWAQVTNISGTEVLRSNSDFSEVKTRFLMVRGRTRRVALKPTSQMKFFARDGGKSKMQKLKFRVWTWIRFFCRVWTMKIWL